MVNVLSVNYSSQNEDEKKYIVNVQVWCSLFQIENKQMSTIARTIILNKSTLKIKHGDQNADGNGGAFGCFANEDGIYGPGLLIKIR